MTGPKTPVGALVWAFEKLKPEDAETAQRMAALVGFTPCTPEAVSTGSPPQAITPAEPEPEPEPTSPAPAESFLHGPEDSAPIVEPARTAPSPFDTALTRLSAVVTSTAQPRAARSQRAVPLPLRTYMAAPPPFHPLLEPTWTRGVLTSLLSTRRAAGVDERRLIESISRREELQRLPLLFRKTLARGVRLLVDRTEAMAPFARDVADLVDRMRDVVGHPRVEVTYWSASPRLRSVRRGQAEPLLPPEDGRPVLGLTELGISAAGRSDSSLVDDWAQFAEEHRAAGSPFRLLVPYAEGRWPGWAKPLGPVMWDRSTSIATVRALLAELGER